MIEKYRYMFIKQAQEFVTAFLAKRDFHILTKQSSDPILLNDRIRTTLEIIRAKETNDPDMICWEFFLYGYMCGKRADRARRKHK